MRTTATSKITKFLPRALLAAGIISIFGAAGIVRADNTTPADLKPPEKKKWEATATAGITLTRGNTDNFMAALLLNAKRTWECDEILLGLSAAYGDNSVANSAGGRDSTVTDSYVKGFGQWNHLFTPRTYAGLRIAGEHDDIAAVAYRVIVSPLAGYYFIKETNTTLAGEIGPSYVREKFFSEPVDDFIALRVAERFEHKFASGAKVWESVEWIPKIEDFNNYLVNAEAGVSAPISKALSVSLIAQDSYKSVPAKGKLKNDFKLIAGATYNF
jgi:hypothetical protein